MLILIGWRNLWRNKRRSLIMLGALVTGLWGVIMIYGADGGMMIGMVDVAIMSNTGHIQVHEQGYHANPDINMLIKDPARVLALVRSADHVVSAAPRARATAMLSSARGSIGVLLVGIDPKAEARVSSVARSIKAGRYLKEDDAGEILIGRSAAEKLKVQTGKKLVIYVRGADLELKALGVRIVGVYETGTSAVDEYMAFVPLSYFQNNLGLDGGIHEIAVRIDDERNLESSQKSIIANLAGISGLEVLSWKQMFPFMVQLTDLTAISNWVMLAIVCIAISLGIANTMVMSVYERFREIGIMKAVGTRPGQIFRIILVEALSLALTGLVLGSAVSWLTLLVWEKYGLDLGYASKSLAAIGMPAVIYPIVYFRDWVVTWIAIAVLAVGSSLWPAVKAARKNPVEAMRA